MWYVNWLVFRLQCIWTNLWRMVFVCSAYCNAFERRCREYIFVAAVFTIESWSFVLLYIHLVNIFVIVSTDFTIHPVRKQKIRVYGCSSLSFNMERSHCWYTCSLSIKLQPPQNSPGCNSQWTSYIEVLSIPRGTSCVCHAISCPSNSQPNIG